MVIGRGDKNAWAIFSECEQYRYELGRRWGDGDPLVAICLNPSTATHEVSDPTVTRMIKRAQSWGYGAFVMLNLFAYRATDPRQMKAQAEPVGVMNDLAIHGHIKHDIICGWGCHGSHQGRDKTVLGMLRKAGARIHYLELTKHGHPKHPLYVGYDRQMVAWG